MRLWLRIALIVALAVLLWVLVAEFAENVDGAGGSVEAPAAGEAPLSAP